MTDSVRAPVVDADSAPFWDAVADHRLTAQQCAICERFVFYPRVVCPFCHGDELNWKPLAGTGTIYSFTVSRRAPSPEFADLVPYVVLLVDLDEGCRLMSNLVGDNVHLVRCGARVAVRFEDVPGGQTLPMFELTEGLR
jgi:hypothetical protein